MRRQAFQNAGALRPVINLRTAKLLGSEVPETLLATADEVIEYRMAALSATKIRGQGRPEGPPPKAGLILELGF